jgi:hypothetical protein
LVTFFQIGLAKDNNPDNYYNPLNIQLELGFNSGYLENLLNDSTDIEDSYSTANVRALLYPQSNIELNLYTSYTYYGKSYDLSNSAVGVGGTFIPTGESSPLTFYLATDFNGRSYREDYKDFDNNNFSFISSIGYRLGPAFLRTGLSIKTTYYRHSETADRESYDLFAGINATLPGSFSLDIESGLSRMDFSFIPDSVGFMAVIPPFDDSSYADYHTDGHMNSFYISPRLSHSLGARTGLSFTFNHRNFYNSDDKVVIGSAINFISPWANIYEGQSYVLNLKTYLIPHMIVSGGAGYWEKTFFKTHMDDFYPVYEAQKRRDSQSRYYLNLERPVAIGEGLLKPVLSFEYSNNTSSFDLYEYSGIAMSLGVTYTF